MTIATPVITIDGPSGAGKGTLCKALADVLKWNVLDSGAIYRVLALLSLFYQKTATGNEKALAVLASELNVRFDVEDHQLKVMLGEKNVTQIIRTESIGNTASQIAQLPYVRQALLQRQRAFRASPGLIADGRDMGTVVFPDSPIKIFLNATQKERVHRRMRQLQEKGFNVNFKNILFEIKKRDDRDRNRIAAPLIPAAGALLLNSTYLTIGEMVIKVLAHVRQTLAL